MSEEGTETEVALEEELLLVVDTLLAELDDTLEEDEELELEMEDDEEDEEEEELEDVLGADDEVVVD